MEDNVVNMAGAPTAAPKHTKVGIKAIGILVLIVVIAVALFLVSFGKKSTLNTTTIPSSSHNPTWYGSYGGFTNVSPYGNESSLLSQQNVSSSP